MSKSILIADSATIDLKPASISSEWIHNGNPETRSQALAGSHDRTSHTRVANSFIGGRFACDEV